MKIETNKPISDELRGFMRTYLSVNDLREIADLNAVSWETLRAISRKLKPTRVTHLTQPVVIPMLRLAINNKMRWAVTVRDKIDNNRSQINRMKTDLTNAEKNESEARLTIDKNADNNYKTVI